MTLLQKTLTTIGLACVLHGQARAKDAPKDPVFRGFMIDAPRGVETLDYYFRLMDFCQAQAINVIIFRLADDQGSVYRFSSHPELNLCDGAFSARELTRLVEYAKSKGIEMIPEIESFGHSRYITQTKKYAFLNDGPAGEDFNALCPVNPAALDLLQDLYAEAATIFTGPYFHLGCDEVNWGSSAASKTALLTKSKSQIWAGYVNQLNGRLKALGKTAMIWADVPLYQERSVLDLLDKDLVLIDWNYWESDKAKVADNARAVLSRGFKLIGCPAASWCGWGPRVGALQFKNINAYAEVYAELGGPNNLGVIVSNWVPKRYLQNSQWDTYTIAAQILRHQGHYNYPDAIPQFVENHFGAQYDPGWATIYQTLYEAAPQAGCGKNAALKFLPWAAEKDLKAALFTNKHAPNPFRELAKLAAPYQERVTKNPADFADLLLTIEFMAYCHDRQEALLRFAETKPTDEPSVARYFQQVAQDDQRLWSKLEPAWSRGRRGQPDVSDKDLLWSFPLAAAYARHLAANPGEFLSLLHDRKN